MTSRTGEMNYAMVSTNDDLTAGATDDLAWPIYAAKYDAGPG